MGASAREHDDVGTYDARAVGRHPADAEIEIERLRRSAGNLWFLRVGMAVFGGGLGGYIGLEIMKNSLLQASGINRDILGFQIIALIVLMMGLFIFFEFLIELRLRRSVERRCSGERK